MADRSIKVRLSAQVTDFTREINKAAGSLDELVKKSGDASGAANTTMGRLAQSAKLQADSWNTVGAGMVGVGAAITGVNVLVAKTGIEYNTLQQKSRAALTTILGGAQEANAQMNKLDEFARTSPFSKAVFIEAQQQMLGFGIEAQKVIPYLSAINETIAATGGNNNDLAEIVRIFSQISAAGKITATDLMQFGQRGVDAATLIGSQMGMTGAEIRDSITAGTLDAGGALDALAAGMQGRFEGASAGVKNTMEGAFDRVKAAWRDLSASMMEPAVGQSGGGFLVDLTNGVADFLRAIDALPDSVKMAGGLLSGVGGAATLAAGGFMLLVPQVHATVTAVKALSTAFPRAVAMAGPVGVAIAALTTVVGLAAGAFMEHRSRIEDYKNALSGVGEEADKAIRADILMRASKLGLIDAMGEINVGWATMVDAMLGSTSAHDLVIRKFDEEIAAQQAVMHSSSRTQTEYNRSARTLGELKEQKRRYIDMMGDELDARQAANVELERENGILAEGDEYRAKRAAADAAMWERHSDGKRDAAEATRELSDEEQKWLDTVVGSSAGFIDHFAALEAAQQRYAERAAVNAGEATDAWQDFATGGKFALGDFRAALEEQVAAMDAWETNIIALHGRVSQATIDSLIEMGKTNPELAAQAAAGMVAATDKELREIDPMMGRIGQSGGLQFAGTLESTVGDYDLHSVMTAVGHKMGADARDAAAGELARGEATLADIVARYDLRAQLELDTDPAERAARAALSRIRAMMANMSDTARVRAYHANGFDAQVATGGYMQDVADAYYNRLAGGGQARMIRPNGYLSGPGTGTSDDIPARLSTKEFVMNAAATQHYGPDFLYRLNSRSVDRDWLHALGMAGGGSPSTVAPPPTPVASMVTRSSSTVNIGSINVTTAAGTADGILAEVARELPAFFAQRG